MRTAQSTFTDAELVSASLAGGRSAFEELARRHERSVVAVALSVLRDHDAAQDVAQDALLTSYRKLASLRDPASFGHWVLRITRRAALRSAKSLRRRNRPQPIEAAGEIQAPFRPAVFNDEECALLAAVNRLPEGERVVVLLRHFDGHSLPDIARLLGRPLGSVTKQLSRAHQRLRDQLEGLRP